MGKFLDIDVLNYSIKSLSKMIDITFLKKKQLFNVTPEYYRLFDASTDNPSLKLTVVNNDKKPLGVGEVTSDTVRNVTKDANIYKVGAEVVHIEEILVPKFDNIKGIDKTDLDTIKADTKTNRQKAYNSNVLFIVDDKTMEFYDRDKDKFEPILNGTIDVEAWEVSHNYIVNDKVKYDNNIYQCIKSHTSSVFEDETDNWIKIIDDYVVLTQGQQDYLIKNNLIEDKLYLVTDTSDEGSSGGSTSGTNDYADLINKPSINNIELVGNKNLSDLGIDTYDDTTIKKNISSINKAIGDIDGLTIVGVKDLVSAVNKLDLSFMQSIVYNNKDGKKLLTITYKNGNTTDIDLSAIITSTNIGELANVDDSAITDKQVLSYDSSIGKYIPITIDNSNVLQEAKDYTDKQINAINHAEGKVVDSKPTIVNNGDGTYTITYIKSGVSTTTKDSNIWFFYNTGTNTYAQTIFIEGVEVTLSMNGSIDLTDYVNKTTDLASGFTGNEIDKTKVTTIKELDDLLAIINTHLSKKVNTSDIINDLLHEDINKPLSAKQGKELKRLIDDISISITGGGSVILKKSFENVTANTVNKFDSPLPLDNACMINVYKKEKGNININESLEEFKNNTKQDFIKNEDEIIIDDNGARIKNKYSYKAIFDDTTNIFKTVLDINNFIDINSFECEVV